MTATIDRLPLAPPDGAGANVHRHYDLSNELFELFADESMTYSSAWFGAGDDLHAAQLRKIDGVLDYAGVTEGSRVLEIGTGWGALAIRAARRARRSRGPHYARTLSLWRSRFLDVWQFGLTAR